MSDEEIIQTVREIYDMGLTTSLRKGVNELISEGLPFAYLVWLI